MIDYLIVNNKNSLNIYPSSFKLELTSIFLSSYLRASTNQHVYNKYYHHRLHEYFFLSKKHEYSLLSKKHEYSLLSSPGNTLLILPKTKISQKTRTKHSHRKYTKSSLGMTL